MSTAYCPCGAELKSLAAQAHKVCDGCRKSKKPVRRRKVEPADTEQLFDVEPQQRRLVEVPGWPDYAARGMT